VDLLSNKNIESLILDAKGGDEDAFYELYEHLNKPLFAFVLARTSSREDALDILQDVFIDLWRSFSKFKYSSDKQFYAFVYKISRRKLSKYYNNSVSHDEFDERFVKHNYEIDTEDYRLLKKAIGQLDEKYREVLELRYWADLSFSDIAQILDSQESATKVRHHRAIKKLNEILKKYG